MEIIEEGQRAKELKDNPFFEKILKEIEDEIILSWIKSAPDQKDEREITYSRMEAIRKIRLEISKRIQNATIEKDKFQQEGDSNE